MIEKFEDGNEEERMRYSKPEPISVQWALSSVTLPSQHTHVFLISFSSLAYYSQAIPE